MTGSPANLDVAFLVTGQGRSGTMWLAKVLDGDPAVKVFHEACGALDAQLYGAFHRGLNAVPYLDGVRKEFVSKKV